MNVLEQLMTYYAQNGSYVMDEFGRHFLMSVYRRIVCRCCRGSGRNPHCALSPLISLGVRRNKCYPDNPGARDAGRFNACHGARRKHRDYIIISVFPPADYPKHVHRHCQH